MRSISFGNWTDEVHEEEKQLRAIEKARKWDCAPAPDSLDRVNQKCEFHGDHGDYSVTLDSCDCGAFRQLRSRAPCKHIYRLAAELGLIDIQMQDGRSRRDVSDGMFSLSPESQKFLYENLRYNPSLVCIRTPELTAIAEDLISHGFFTEQLSGFAAFAKDAGFVKESMSSCGISEFEGLRNDKRVYFKALVKVEQDSIGLLLEKLIFLQATEAAVNALNTIEKRFRKKFKKIGVEEDEFTGFTRIIYDEQFDNNPV